MGVCTKGVYTKGACLRGVGNRDTCTKSIYARGACIENICIRCTCITCPCAGGFWVIDIGTYADGTYIGAWGAYGMDIYIKNTCVNNINAIKHSEIYL